MENTSTRGRGGRPSSSNGRPRGGRGGGAFRGGRPQAQRRQRRTFATPEGEMNSLFDRIQAKIDHIVEEKVKRDVQSSYEKLQGMRETYYSKKMGGGEEDKTKANEYLERELLKFGRSVFQMVQKAKKMDPGLKPCPDVSCKEAESLFMDDNTSLGSLSSTEEEQYVEAKNSMPASQDEQKNKKGKEMIKVVVPEKSKNKKKEKWWHILTDVDPITVEPLAELPYPPFELVVRTENDKVSHYFDGRMLAHYVVSTGNFSNPNTRQPLTRAQCQSLDAYLAQNKLPLANVTDAFDLSKRVNIQLRGDVQGTDEQAVRRAEALRRDATVMMNSLFDFSYDRQRDRGGPLPNRNRQRRGESNRRQQDQNVFSFSDAQNTNVVSGEGNLRVIDGDIWVDSTLNSMEDFPAMPAPAPAAPRYTPPPSPPRRQGQAVAAPRGPAFVPRANAPSWPGRGDGLGRMSQSDLQGGHFPSLGASTSGASAAASWGAPAPQTQQEKRPPVSMASILSSASDGSKMKTQQQRSTVPMAIKSERPKLQLKKPEVIQEALQMESLSSASRNSAIFGSGRPKEEVVSHHTQDQQQQQQQSGSADLAIHLSKQNVLTPYPPRMIHQARKIGLNTVHYIEHEMSAFLRTPSSQRTTALRAMPAIARSFVHTLGRNYYGLETSSIDPEPNRQVILSKTSYMSQPDITITQAMLDFEPLYETHANTYKETMTLKRSTSTPLALGENSIGLWEVELSGGGRITDGKIEEVFQPFARPSSYHVKHVDTTHILLEFSDRITARKVYTNILSSTTPHGWGGLHWKRLQWWPVEADWASYQLSLLEKSSYAQLQKEREQRRAEKKAEKLKKQRANLLKKFQNASTGWDSDEDAVGMKNVTHDNNKKKKKSNQTSSSTVWHELQSSSSEESD